MVKLQGNVKVTARYTKQRGGGKEEGEGRREMGKKNEEEGKSGAMKTIEFPSASKKPAQ